MTSRRAEELVAAGADLAPASHNPAAASSSPLQHRIGHEGRHRLSNRGIVGALQLVLARQQEIDHLLTEFDLDQPQPQAPVRFGADLPRRSVTANKRFLDLRTRSRAGVIAIALACNSVTVCVALLHWPRLGFWSVTFASTVPVTLHCYTGPDLVSRP